MEPTSDLDVNKLIDEKAIAEFDPKQFLDQVRQFTAEHPEVTERIIVYVDEPMKERILAELSDEEKKQYTLISLAELVAPVEAERAGAAE